MCLRLSKEVPTDPAQSLCEPVYSPQWPKDQDIYVSRSVMRATIVNNEAVLAKGGGGQNVVSMTITSMPDESSSPAAAMAVPIRGNLKLLDVLYVLIDSEYANTDWLALYCLIAKQVEIGELAWAMQITAARQAVQQAQQQAQQNRKR
jgi:hypothetical protein